MSSDSNKRCFTIMIVPHTEEATFSLRIPLFAVQLLVAFLVLVVVAISLLGHSYIKASAEAKEAELLRQVNRSQQEEINALALETEKMMDQVRSVDELVDYVTNKLDSEAPELQVQAENQAHEHEGSVVADIHENSAHDSFHRFYSSRSSADGVSDRATENLELLQDIIPEKSETLLSVGEYVERSFAKPSIWPCRGRLASGFGMRPIPYSSGYQFHTGVDIIGAHGTQIWASADGKVTFTGYRGSYGNIVIIDHGYSYETYYAHLSDFAVSVGDVVERGQVVGYMGASGRTTGTHLHYEVHYKGSPVNPYNYMKTQ